MLNLSRIIYRVAAWLFFVGVVVQVFLAGMALFPPTPSNWVNHVGIGYLVGYILAPLIIFAFIGRMPKAIKIQMGMLVLLYIVQTILPSLRTSVPIVSALHPVNAMLLFWFSLRHARQAGSITLSTVST